MYVYACVSSGKEKNGESSKDVKGVEYSNVSDVPESAPNTKEREEVLYIV